MIHVLYPALITSHAPLNVHHPGHWVDPAEVPGLGMPPRELEVMSTQLRKGNHLP